ncbi:MAG: hypothetical protein MUE30_10580 [Spirosomaceae bacterium]|nr:hypothetical protein [Spirosomataceae bacterium]
MLPFPLLPKAYKKVNETTEGRKNSYQQPNQFIRITKTTPYYIYYRKDGN